MIPFYKGLCLLERHAFNSSSQASSFYERQTAFFNLLDNMCTKLEPKFFKRHKELSTVKVSFAIAHETTLRPGRAILARHHALVTSQDIARNMTLGHMTKSSLQAYCSVSQLSKLHLDV